MSEFRTDPLFGSLSIVARERAVRPQRTRVRDEIEASGPCPLCPGNESLCPPEVVRLEKVGDRPVSAGRWQIRVFPNRYPALGLESEISEAANPGAIKAYESKPGFGVHEVLVESPNHTLPFWALEPEQGVALFEVLQSRIRDLHKDRRLASLSVFKNHRAASGASLEHPHMQIMGLPFVPEPVTKLLSFDRCGVCQVLDHEYVQPKKEQQDTGVKATSHDRLLTETNYFVALADYAPHYSYQFSIYPKTHQSGFEDASKEMLEDLAQLCTLVFGRFERLLGECPMNIAFYSQPNPQAFVQPSKDSKWYEKMHWFIRVFPRMGRKAGFELASGISLVHVAPEDAARAFKEKGV